MAGVLVGLFLMASLRIGELLPKLRHQFDAKKDLLASDVKFYHDSVSLWIRSPKYEASPTGDVVEVWSVKDRLDLDPVSALSTFMRKRREKFSDAENLPLFLHENGHIFSKQELNDNLSLLLSRYPELASDRDKWSGHSFRSGISTVLSVLGFCKEDIQSWGRWHGDAYLRYIKDQSQRRNVQARLALTFKKMLSSVE